MAISGIEVEIYKDTAPFDKIGVIEQRQSPTILREIEAVGAGSFVIAKNNRKILEDPSLLDYRNFVRVRVNGVCQGGFILKNKDHVIVGEGEEREEAWTISGEGLRSWGKDAAVRPAKGISLVSRETRYFNFASEQGSWYVPSQWANATQIFKWGPPAAGWRGTAPSDWPDVPNAYWIWDRGSSSYAMPQGYVYFRREFSVSEDGQYALFFAVDDAAEVYLDGELIHTTAEHAWEQTTRQDVDLSAGQHILAFKAYNYKSDGPGSLIAAFFKIGNATSPTAAQLLFVTDSQWKVCGYPAIEPGWSPGNIILTLLAEAKARNIRFAQNWTTTFTNTHDSAGTPWGDPISISFDVGTNYEEVFEALEEAACDIYLDAETLKLYAWKKRGADRSIDNTEGNEPIILRVGHNLRTADEKGQADIVNTLLLKTADGWEVVQPTTGDSVSKYGVLEGQISTDMTKTAASGLVGEVFNKKSQPEKTATFELIPVPGMVPLEDFFEGDYVSAPGEVPGVMEKRRVMSISITENSIGDPVYAVEFDAIFGDRTDDLAKLLSKATHSSALGSGFTGTTGTPQTPTQGSNAQVPVSATPEAPSGLTVDTVGRWADNGTAVSDYALTWSPVVSNVNNLPVSDIERYEVWGRKATDSEYGLLVTVFDSFAYLSGHNPGEDWYFQVRALSRTGGFGNFSEPQHLVAAAPIVPLGQPSKPTLVSEMGAVAIRWDGLIDAAAPAPRYKHMEIQRSTAQNGTYTLIGSLVTGSGVDQTGVVGTTYWYRLVPVDYLGVKGTPSLPASIQVAPVSTSELDAALNDAINGAGAKAQEALDKAVQALGDAALAVVSLITEYAVNSSESTAPTTGWSTTSPARTPGTFVWQRTITTYGDDRVETSAPALLTGNTGASGTGIASAAVTYQTSSSGTTAPTGTWSSTVPSVSPGQFLWARTVTTLTNNATVTSYAVSQAGATGSAGTAATNIVVGNDAVAFPVSTTGATLAAYTVTIPFSGWIGTSRAAATVAVSGLPSGITAGTNTPATTSADGSLILNVASGSTLGGANSGDILLTFTVNGLTFTRRFSWAKAITGATGADGAPGATGKGLSGTAITYQAGTSGTTAPTGTWATSVPTVTPGQFLWTRTVLTYTDSSTATSYSVSRAGADGAQGSPGAPGSDGQTSYLHVAYATNATGTAGFSTTDPSGKTYMGTYTDFTAADSTDPAAYEWVLIKGADGSTGAPGKGISSAAVTYQVSSSGTTTPTGTWAASPPALTPGQYLWTRTILTFTDGATTTTYSIGQAGATGSAGTAATSVDIGNEAVVIPATSAGATTSASTITIPFTGFIGNSRAAATVAVSGLPTGITVQTNTAGTTSAAGTLVLAVANGSTLGGGATGNITLTVTVNGIAFVRTFTWTKGFTGADGSTGSPGAPGKGVASVTPYYLLVVKGAAAPAAPTTNPPSGGWSISEPAWADNTVMYRAELFVFTDNTFGWSGVSKVSTYDAASQAIFSAGEAVNLANLADAAAKGTVKAQSADPGHQLGRIWLQLDGSGRVVGVKVSNGSAWASYAMMADQILVPSSVGTVSIKDGAISSPKLLIASLENQLDNPNFQTGTFDGWDRTGATTGWDLPTSSAAYINRHLRRVTGATAAGAGQVTNLFRVEVRPGQRLRIDAMSYCEGIVPGPWTDARRNLFPDPLAVSSGLSAIWGAPTLGTNSEIGDMPGSVNSAVRWTRTAAGAALTHALVVGTTLTRGNVRVRMRVRASEAMAVSIVSRPSAASSTGQITVANVSVPAGVSEINVTGSAGTFTTTATSAIGVVVGSGVGVVGATLDITNIAIEAQATATGDVFSGASTTTSDLEQYVWTGTPNASQSVFQTRTAPSSIGVQYYNASGAALTYSQRALSSSGNWADLTWETNVPDNAYFASLRVEDAGVANSTLRLANLQFRVMGAGQLMVDGSVITRHLASESVDSSKVKALSIEVDRLSPNVGSALNLDGNTNINALTTTVSSQQDVITQQQQRLDSVAAAAAEAGQGAAEASSTAAAVVAQANGLQAGLDATQKALDNMGRTYRFTETGAFVGSPGSPYEFVIQNTGAEIRYNGVPVSSWDAGQMIVNSFVGNEVVLGNHKLEKDAATGGTVVRKIGG